MSTTIDWAGFIPMDPLDADRLPPEDLNVCTACNGAGAILPNPADPAGVHDCTRCGGDGQVAA